MAVTPQASNQIETLEKALAAIYGVSTENEWKSVLWRNVNRIKPNRLRLKRLISTIHDLSISLNFRYRPVQ